MQEDAAATGVSVTFFANINTDAGGCSLTVFSAGISPWLSQAINPFTFQKHGADSHHCLAT